MLRLLNSTTLKVVAVDIVDVVDVVDDDALMLLMMTLLMLLMLLMMTLLMLLFFNDVVFLVYALGYFMVTFLRSWLDSKDTAFLLVNVLVAFCCAEEIVM